MGTGRGKEHGGWTFVRPRIDEVLRQDMRLNMSDVPQRQPGHRRLCDSSNGATAIGE